MPLMVCGNLAQHEQELFRKSSTHIEEEFFLFICNMKAGKRIVYFKNLRLYSICKKSIPEPKPSISGEAAVRS